MTDIWGMDIGGTSIKLGAWHDEERVCWQPGLTVPATAEAPAVVADLVKSLDGLRNEVDAAPVALGIGSCGLIRDGVILQSPNTPWDQLPLVELLGAQVDYPVCLLNDADAFLLDALQTLPDQHSVVLGITLGTGIGTALWLGDRLFSGGSGISPEGGHITLAVEGEVANTGIPGSWESLAARNALLRYYWLAGGIAVDEPKAIAKVAQDGEAAALQAWQRLGRYLGAGLASLCNFCSPEHVLLGGGLAGAHELYLATLQDALNTHLLHAIPVPELHFIPEREDAVAHGAARYAMMMHVQ